MHADACNGYFCDFEVYVGKAEDSITVEHGLGERVVLRLTESIRGLNHKLFCDNLFSTPGLFRALLDRDIYACGTDNPNRKDFPADLKGEGWVAKGSRVPHICCTIQVHGRGRHGRSAPIVLQSTCQVQKVL